MTAINPPQVMCYVQSLLLHNEQVVGAYKTMRDFVVFANMRVVAVNVQGISSKKRGFSSLPYSEVSAYLVKISGTFVLDGELELYLSGVVKVKFGFSGNVNIAQVGQVISSYILRQRVRARGARWEREASHNLLIDDAREG